MSEPALVVVGFEVVIEDDKGRRKRVSPTYTAKSAAEHFRDLYLKQYPGSGAWVADVVKPEKQGRKAK